MKQVLQQPQTGEISVVEVPAPAPLPGCVVVRIAASLVSAGTERASSEFAGKNLLQKAKARPDLVREVMAKVRRDGVLSAVSAVRTRLDQPSALGYSSAGTVIAIGEGVTDINVGDRVACAGAGYAVHAEMACIPRLLLAKLPVDAEVSFDEAAFTTLGAVALHGARTGDIKVGDVVAVIGLGLLGQITAQVVKSAGCRVVGMDISAARAALAQSLGADLTAHSAETFAQMCQQASRGHGADVVLITAETPSSEPVNLAAQVARDRGTVVAIGTVGIEIQRRLYYEKELDFRISRSYGPGRHDVAYEQKGRDYPVGYVRWTETRNMEAFVDLLAAGKLNLQALITHRIDIKNARRAYEVITGNSGEPFLGVLINYPGEANTSRYIPVHPASERHASKLQARDEITIGLLGAGGFAQSTLIPAMQQVANLELVTVCNATGSRASHAAKKFGFRNCSTDESNVFNDAGVNTVVIATRHHLHAAQVRSALVAGKNVFCEKPLCLTEEELTDITDIYKRANARLMVGFNRRFAPMAVQLKSFFSEVGAPLTMHYRVNAGAVPNDHWLTDPEQGGGRILGEVCHFIDFLSFLSAGSPPVEVQTRSLTATASSGDLNVIISLQYANGNQGTIDYLTNGDRSHSKERLEVFGGGAIAILEDFRTLELISHGRKRIFRSRLRQDKGHLAEWQAFADSLRHGKPSPIAFDEIANTTLTTIRAEESRLSGRALTLSPFMADPLSDRFEP